MSFRLSKEARQYFIRLEGKSTTGKFSSFWDKYYLCLMVGFLNKKFGKEPPTSMEFLRDFVQDYSPQRYQIIALLISTELKRQGIKKDDKESIQKNILELIDHSKITGLSDEGQKLMNRYAQGGFEKIYEDIKQPYEFDVFIKEYFDRYLRIDDL